MRKQLLAMGLMMAALVAAPAFAETKIAVIDVQKALVDSDAYKKTAENLNTQLKPQRDRMDVLKKELDALEAKAQKDQAIMSDTDKKNLQKQGEAKYSEYQALAQAGAKAAQDAQNDLLQRMGPKLEVIIDELRKQGGYDIIADRKALIYVDPSLDLTKKVTEKLNAAK